MNFTVERPYAFFGIALLVPVILITIYQYRKVSRTITSFQAGKVFSHGRDLHVNHFSRVIILRTIFRSLSWCMMVMAFAGFSWGTYLEPVQKSGNAISMVFDISWSMMAMDGIEGTTRLNSSINFAKLLLSRMDVQNISVVLAKGDGVVVVPVTEDKVIVESLLDSLSPNLMSSVGTSLGNGVSTALKSFPANSALANRIWLFTDGEETDGQLEKALTDCLKSGVNVSIIGFGRESETTALAGDGKTRIRTALRSGNLRTMCYNVVEKNPDSKKSGVNIEFIDSTEPGSAVHLLSPVLKASGEVSDGEEDSSITYELKPVQRYTIFLVLAFLFFTMSFIVSEINIDFFSRKKIIAASMIFACFTFTSCGTRFDGSKKILTSSWAWNQSRYNKAVAGFLQTSVEATESQDFDLNQYAVYDLGTTYLMQSETKAALERFSQIDENAPDNILYATYYNMGIIAHRNGEYEKAAECFRNALRKDSSKTDAKINLELSLMKLKENGNGKEKTLKAASENKTESSSKENSVFNIIREYEKQQWKNSESVQNSNASEDY